MRKLNLRVIAFLLAIMLCVTALSATALADDDDYYDDYYDDEATEAPAASEQPTEVETPGLTDGAPAQTEPKETTGGLDAPFTPDGNLSLIDDFSYSGVDADGNVIGKQFITVQSKAGSYFFIIIDRAGSTENVFFLNMVDEADLLALIDTSEETEEPAPAVCTCSEKCYAGHVDTSCPVCAVNMSECTGKEAQPEPTAAPAVPEPETTKKSGGNPVPVLILLLALGGGTAFYFLKVRGKAKPKTKGNADLDDYDYGAAEDDEYECEQYDPETEKGKSEDAGEEDS